MDRPITAFTGGEFRTSGWRTRWVTGDSYEAEGADTLNFGVMILLVMLARRRSTTSTTCTSRALVTKKLTGNTSSFLALLILLVL